MSSNFMEFENLCARTYSFCSYSNFDCYNIITILLQIEKKTEDDVKNTYSYWKLNQ